MKEEDIARVDLYGFESEIVESLYFEDEETLNECIADLIEVGRAYTVNTFKDNINVLTVDEYYG